jgi:threonylcarbamoyladenosine tRNA methylthiotransferase MtaB
MQRQRVHISALGCKLNQAEAESWARQLEERGHVVVGRLEEADLHVVNSCAVTREAVRDSERAARRGRADRGLRTVLTGCAAGGPLLGRAQGLDVDRVVDNHEKDRLVDLLELHGLLGPGGDASMPARGPLPLGERAPFLRAGRRLRVSLKIEDGCSMGCAFCIIPSTRGAQRSRSAREVVEELVDLESRGYAEVVVTGVQISAYRDGDLGLCELVERLLAATSRVRLRLTSIAPWQFDERLIELLGRPRICRHVHLSLQSGCAATLRRMRRPDRPERFADLVGRLRAEVPGIAITSDVIVGFPGENEVEWSESLEFVRVMAFARLHVFPYSERPGTLGAGLADPVPVELRRERVARMRDASAAGARDFLATRLGEVVEVLWERRRNGAWIGVSDNYVRVALAVEQAAAASEPPARGVVSRVRIAGIERGLACAELAPIGAGSPALPGGRPPYQAVMLKPAST